MVVTNLRKVLVPLVVVVLAAAAALTMFNGDDTKHVSAHFPRTVSLYEGSEVRVLGVPVGTVESITPEGTDVVVEMAYRGDVDVPADAQALLIAPAIVGDRYVQLSPAYSGGEALPDNAELDTKRTSTPLELDEIYSSINDLNVALGPEGANKDGALSDLLVQTAKNFSGQGKAFNQTLTDFATLSRTLDRNKDELFGASRELNNFLGTLARNDSTVRKFNTSLASVSDLLADERQDLVTALDRLGTALGEVNTFVKTNRAVLGRDIKGLNKVTKNLVRQRSSLDEVLRVAPLALNNLALTYNPQAGTLDTRANLGEITGQLTNDPALLLCTVVNQVDTSGNTCDALDGILPRAGALGGGQQQRPERPVFDPTLAGLVEVDR